MKNSEAIRILRTTLLCLDATRKKLTIKHGEDLYRYREAVECATHALESTMQKKSKWKIVDGYFIHENCRNINSEIYKFDDRFDYCPNCGECMYEED